MVDAAYICEQLGIPITLSIAESLPGQYCRLSGRVYSAGITPLPCSQCNKTVKFGPMVQCPNNWATGLLRVTMPELRPKSGRYQLRAVGE